jgi:intracellular sulfur oxidation DsrE/DsrF family protein
VIAVASRMLRTLFAALLLAPLVCALPAVAADKHRLALQISDNDADKMNAVLNVAANVSKYYADKGEEVDIQIVAFNAGLHMLRDDTSPVKPRLKSFKQGMPNVSFMACENTLDAMTRKEGKEPALVENAERVKAGVVTLIELGEKGWTIVRP